MDLAASLRTALPWADRQEHQCQPLNSSHPILDVRNLGVRRRNLEEVFLFKCCPGGLWWSGALTSGGVDGRLADTSNPAVSGLSRGRTAGQATTPPAVIHTHEHTRAMARHNFFVFGNHPI